MVADTDEKINECIEKSLNYLSAIGRPIDLKYDHEQRISIQHLLLGKHVIAVLPTGVGKSTNIYRVCFDEQPRTQALHCFYRDQSN